MKKRKKDNGFDELVFEKGDGMLVRWADALQGWRMSSPENRELPHPMKWYLDEANLLPRPTIGLLSLSRFAEKLLWRAYKYCPDTRASAKAQRLFGLVRRRMAQLKYRGAGRSRRVQCRRHRMYLQSSVRACAAMARDAFDAVEAMGRHRCTISMTKALR